MTTEHEYLQNFGTRLGLTIHEKFTEDKRRTVKRYFACLGTMSVSPVLDYEQLNYFMLGWNNSLKHTDTSNK